MGALVALDVTLDEFDVVADVQQVLAPSGGEVVEHAHALPVRQQTVHDVRTDEAAPARHQNLCVPYGHDGMEPYKDAC